MSVRVLNPLRRFAENENGSVVVPFAMWMPVFIGLVLATIEVGTVTIRSTALERALDETVREVRLGNAGDQTAIKQSICNRAAVLPDCLDRLQLEMVRLDMRNWSNIPNRADCVDTSEVFTPNRAFQNAGGSEVMFLRACFKYRPITPAGNLSANLPEDDEGFTAITASSAFVTEPS
ncbi:TadE/TadG family type IV pilus assembly protein [Thalassococcus lentus]|uniref:Pilus assembly protein n=1 Tax=Thalassococcus lentus TaxID=1210524 RepID=A0ABT4XVY7_9RHOB|nr:TadE family protein [Thalassococcus lentus]MDA7426093.1 pilus assembly protein [Thalassococcus lentus]